MAIKAGAVICIVIYLIALLELPKLSFLKSNLDESKRRDMWELMIKAALYFVILILAISLFKVDDRYYLEGFIIVVSSLEVISNARAAYKIFKE